MPYERNAVGYWCADLLNPLRYELFQILWQYPLEIKNRDQLVLLLQALGPLKYYLRKIKKNMI